MNAPLVSIIIPVYNGSRYMSEAIDSALAQTYSNVEVIVVNDGSNDAGETDRIARSYGERIRYFVKENGGVSSALNLGIEKMYGQYFSWLSHDDVYAPEKIEKQMKALQNFGDENSVALCACRQIDENSVFLARAPEQRFNASKIEWQDALWELLRGGSYNGCAFLLPKSVFQKCGTFNEELRYSQDVLMWMNMFLKEFSIIHISDPCVYGRVHAQQLTNRGRSIFYRDSIQIGNLMIPQLSERSSEAFPFLLAFAQRNAKMGNDLVVKKCVEVGQSMEILERRDVLKLKLLQLYGRIRPFLRKVFYLLLKIYNKR